MRIAGLLLIGATLLPVAAGAEPGGPAHMGTGMSRPAGGAWTGGHRWGPRHNGRWYAGWRAPGGWNGYRRPVYGFVLPRYWVSPNYYIANSRAYGLPAPAYGYGWSRYYDDAVMTDRWGRVYDYRTGIDWDRYEGGYGPHEAGYGGEPRRDNGVGGAAVGAVVGGIAGNRIAGRGNRTLGTLVGAGVGAVAGAAIDKAEDRGRALPPQGERPGAAYDDDYVDDGVTSQNDYEGRWTGTWTTDDGRKVSGTYEGRFEGEVRGAGVEYDTPPYDGLPHWSSSGMGAPAGGYIANGYYYPAPIVTTVTVQPATTTTTTTTYVTKKVRYLKPAPGRTVRHCRCK